MVETYTEYENINKKIAEDVYGPQLEELNKQFSDDLTALLDNVSGEAAEKGAEYILNFISGMDTSSDEAIDSAKKSIDELLKTVDEEISNSTLEDGKLTLGLDKVDGKKAGKKIADNLADGIDKNSNKITDSVKKAVEKEMQNIKIAVEARIKTVVDNYSVPASSQPVNQTQNTTEKVVEKIVYRDVKLVWKDGRALAEIVNDENKRKKIEGGRV
jgi:polyhydroxyalkanoate synthesis regulator phasin